MRAWRSEQLFDLCVFLDCDLDEAVERLTNRHVKTGLASTPQEGYHRAVTNDRVNAEVILSDGCRERADLNQGGRSDGNDLRCRNAIVDF